jgi:hypothetical protein
MVARILIGKSIRGLLQYNESKVESGDATLILANRFGLEIEQLQVWHKQARFEYLTKFNSRVKTNAVHVMLNFDRLSLEYRFIEENQRHDFLTIL